MRKKFVKTNNVKKFITMMNNLQNRAEGVPGMGLVYGEPGLGKTYAITWWAMQNNAVFIRCTNNMSSRWLLEELVEELGEIPYSKLVVAQTHNGIILCVVEGLLGKPIQRQIYLIFLKDMKSKKESLPYLLPAQLARLPY